MTSQPEFMFLFRLQPAALAAPPTAAAHAAWQAFIGTLAARQQLISTTRLEMEARVISQDRGVVASPLPEDQLALSGNMVIRAASLAEATELAQSCPILAAGGSVEVRPLIPTHA